MACILMLILVTLTLTLKTFERLFQLVCFFTPDVQCKENLGTYWPLVGQFDRLVTPSLQSLEMCLFQFVLSLLTLC